MTELLEMPISTDRRQKIRIYVPRRATRWDLLKAIYFLKHLWKSRSDINRYLE